MKLISSTISTTISTKKGVKTATVSGNEFNGIEETVNPSGRTVSHIKIGRLALIFETTDIKSAKRWIRETKKKGEIIEVEAQYFI